MHWWKQQLTRCNRRFLQKINPVIDSLYYPQPEGPFETLETAKALTIPRLQHAELWPTLYQPEASDIVPMEVEEVESQEDRDNVTAMEADEGQNQPPSNRVSHRKFCKFTCPNKPDCGWHVDYSNNMVAGQMMAGLANMDHQTKLIFV